MKKNLLRILFAVVLVTAGAIALAKIYVSKGGLKGGIENIIPKEIEGIHREYYTSGVLKSEVPYKLGTKNGVEKMYSENSKLVGEKEFKSGRAMYYKQYYPTGELMAETMYDSFGKAHGTSKIYYEDGKLKYEIFHEHGKTTLSKEYYKNGKLKIELIAENSWRKEYDESGVLIAEGKLAELEKRFDRPDTK